MKTVFCILPTLIFNGASNTVHELHVCSSKRISRARLCNIAHQFILFIVSPVRTWSCTSYRILGFKHSLYQFQDFRQPLAPTRCTSVTARDFTVKPVSACDWILRLSSCGHRIEPRGQRHTAERGAWAVILSDLAARTGLSDKGFWRDLPVTGSLGPTTKTRRAAKVQVDREACRAVDFRHDNAAAQSNLLTNNTLLLKA